MYIHFILINYKFFPCGTRKAKSELNQYTELGMRNKKITKRENTDKNINGSNQIVFFILNAWCNYIERGKKGL